MSEPLHIISLGAGVQSTAMALMAAAGEITPMPDCAIFADTGEEPTEVYAHLDRLIPALPFPVHVVRAWEGYGGPRVKMRLGDELLASAQTGGGTGSHARPPFFTLGANGEKGMIRRQCTGDYKIEPIQRKVRELLGLKPRQRWPQEIRIVQWIGISTDEATRQKPIMQRSKRGVETVLRPHPAIAGRWPLIEKGIARTGCLQWLTAHEFPTPSKSACTFCPFHSDAEWRRIKESPADWERVVQIDRAIRHGLSSKQRSGALYLHASRRPLEEIDFTEAPERQLNLFENECEGMCGV